MGSETRYVDPTWLSDPHWADNADDRVLEGLMVEDVYFAEEQPEPPAAALLDDLLDELADPWREAVRMRVFGSMSYRDIAAEMGWWAGSPPKLDGKRAWRVVALGLRVLRTRITTDPTFAELIPEGLT